VECPIPEQDIYIKNWKWKKTKTDHVSKRNPDVEDLNAVLAICQQ